MGMQEEKKTRQQRLFELFDNVDSFSALSEGGDRNLGRLAEKYGLEPEEIEVARDTVFALKDAAGEILALRCIYHPSL